MVSAGRHDLLGLDHLEIRELIAQPRRVFEIEPLGGRLHAPSELLLDFVVAAFQHLDGSAGIARITFFGDEPDAGRRAPLDLVLQTWPRPICEIGILAIAQPEELLQLLQSLANGAGRGVWAEETAGLLARTAIEAQARKFVLRVQMHEGKTLVVPKHDVEARAVLLDEIELEQQGFRIRIRDRDFHARGLRDQRLHFGMYVARLEIRAHAAFQIACLADIEDLALCIQHAIYARPGRQAVDERLRREWRGYDAHRTVASAMACALAMTASNIGVVRRRVCVL